MITVGLYKNPAAFASVSAQLWGKDAIAALDAKETASRFLGAGTTVGIAILDPEGKVAWKGSDPFKGSTFYTLPGNPPVPYHDFTQGITPYLDKGLLGGLTVPPAGKPVAKLLRTGNLAGAQAVLATLKGDASIEAFKRTLEDRLEALRRQKWNLFDDLMKAEKAWDAYKVGLSYVRCFPKAPDLAEKKDALKALQANPVVKDNLAAKDAFAKLAASGFGSRGKASMHSQVSVAMGQIAQKFGNTEFGGYAGMIAK